MGREAGEWEAREVSAGATTLKSPQFKKPDVTIFFFSSRTDVTSLPHHVCSLNLIFTVPVNNLLLLINNLILTTVQKTWS